MTARRASPEPALPARLPPYRALPVTELIPFAGNPRTHSADQVARIAASITEFGFTNPILIDGKMGIIAGHGRLLAAQKLGLAVVPTIELRGLSDAEARAGQGAHPAHLRSPDILEHMDHPGARACV